MALDDEARQKELERKRLIEQIRKRAEEAELKRIEDEEDKGAPVRQDVVAPSVPSSPPEIPPTATPSPESPGEQRVIELREKLSIALDRGLIEKATALYGELSALIPNDPELRTYQFRLAALQDNKPEAKLKKKKGTEQKEDHARQRAQREIEKKKIGDLLQQANALYQQEKYEKALDALQELLGLDPDNGEAKDFQEQVEKARKLADELRQEEEKRRAALGASKPAPGAALPSQDPKDGDVWGAPTAVVQSETVFEDPEEQAARLGAKETLLERLIQRALKVRIPVKPLVTGVLLIAVALAAYYIVDAVRTTVFPPKHSLLVFPPTSNISDGSADYLLEGVTEELLTHLSGMSELRLIAPTTVLTFMDPRMHTVETAKTMGCMYFVQWSVSRVDEEMTVTLGLFDTVSSAPVWNMQQQVSLREFPALQLELAGEILRRMGVELEKVGEKKLGRIVTTNPEAYDAYLRGRFAMRHHKDTQINQALEEFAIARALDSASASIHSGQGWAYILAHEQEPGKEKGKVFEALRCVQRAVAINPGSAEALRVWAMVHYYNGEYDRALERMEEASAAAPADAETQRRLAYMFLAAGMPDEALHFADESVVSDPRNVDAYTMLGLIRQYRGQYTAGKQEEQQKEFRLALENFEAGARLATDRTQYLSVHQADVLVYLQQHDKAADLLVDRIALERDSYRDFYKLGRVLQSAGKPTGQWQGNFIRARQLIEAKLGTNPDDAVAYSYLALVHTRMGESKEAMAAIERALTSDPGNRAVLYNIARAYSIKREKQEALKFLQQGIGLQYDLDMLLDMDFFNLRNDPDFRAVITRY